MDKKAKTIIYLGISIIAILVITITILATNLLKPHIIEWLTSSNAESKIVEITAENYETEVLNSKKVVLAEFYATWCEPCKTLKPVVEAVASDYDSIKAVEIDIEKNRELVDKYQIKATPTVVVIKNGNEISRMQGSPTRNRILEMCGVK